MIKTNGRPAYDLKGQRFGRWTAIKYNGGKQWLCHCDCGKRKLVYAPRLKNGKSKSCGCLQKELLGNRRRTHGCSWPIETCEYAAWHHMIQRCTYRKNPSWKHYGGRGITVCERWLHSFANFLADMGPRPERLTLERIDVNGNYEPSNCCWDTWSQQNKNQRRYLHAHKTLTPHESG